MARWKAEALEDKVQEIVSIIRNPKGGRYERRTLSGRYIEFTYNPLADGSVLGVYRDITELKDREQALADAKEDIERTRAVMQTVLDNMNDGVILLDKDFSFVFGNDQFRTKLDAAAATSPQAGQSVRGHHPLPGRARRFRAGRRRRRRRSGSAAP